MATNKRKEAAALFELIDKSTLKVPKAGGSLKIPGWWSNKTNPSNKEAAARGAAGGVVAAPKAGGGEAEESADSAAGTATAQEPPLQARLFEPPPANVTPPSSPSIRPPKGPLAAVVADPVKVSAHASDTASAAEPTAKSVAASSPERTGAARRSEAVSAVAARSGAAGSPAPQVLVPPTMDPGRKTWVPPRPRTSSRVPLWALVTGGAVLLIIVCGVALLIKSWGKSTPVNTSTAPQAHEGGTVARSANLYYVVVYTTPAGNSKPTESAAYKNARFLEEHGVDVSIERVDQPVGGAGNRTEGWYWVVTVKGFATATEAKPFRDAIVKIGDQMSLGAWKGAYARNGLSSPGAGGAAVR
jgi:hypothetical protein